MAIELEPIAYLRSPWQDKFGVPRQPGLIPEAWGEVDFVEEFAAPEAREGLEGFSHLWITFLFDQVEESETRLRVRPPRLGGNEKVGVFATRSPFRPNRLGLSVCEIESVFPTLRVKGVDIVDGTPILDIRPYVPYVDAVAGAEAGFALGEPERVPVLVSSEAFVQWEALAHSEQELLRQMVALQPGPAYKKGKGQLFRACVAGTEVTWIAGKESAEILSLEKTSG